jgi:hypothetical protein
MRTTFSEIRLFNDNLSWMTHLLCSMEKSGAQERQREKEQEAESGCKGVAAWVVDLTMGLVFMRV